MQHQAHSFLKIKKRKRRGRRNARHESTDVLPQGLVEGVDDSRSNYSFDFSLFS